MKPLLSLIDVSVRFKMQGKGSKREYVQPLSSVTLDVNPGETLGVLGRNGAGKSTLLKIMSGVIKPDSGQVMNHGVSVSLLALQAGFDRNLTGRDNAIFGGMLLGHSKKAAESRLEEVKEYSELGDFFYEPVRSYSTGMAARLGFAISTVISPDILLIDEVLSVGDAHFKKKAERTMMEKIQSGQTVVLVSHAKSQIEKLCDRCVVLHEGRTLTGGSVSESITIYEELLESV